MTSPEAQNQLGRTGAAAECEVFLGDYVSDSEEVAEDLLRKSAPETGGNAATVTCASVVASPTGTSSLHPRA